MKTNIEKKYNTENKEITKDQICTFVLKNVFLNYNILTAKKLRLAC